MTFEGHSQKFTQKRIVLDDQHRAAVVAQGCVMRRSAHLGSSWRSSGRSRATTAAMARMWLRSYTQSMCS